MLKVILADDHKIIRDGIKAILQGDNAIEIVAEASNEKEVAEVIGREEVDVVLLDIRMPEMDGIETTKCLQENFPAVEILVLSMVDGEDMIKKML